MIRSRTTLVIGPGAGLEIELPEKQELLNRMAAGFDFARLGSDLQTRDMVVLARHLENLARASGATPTQLMDAGQRIRISAKIANSVDAVLEQHSHDDQTMAAGKLSLAYYILQAEARSPLLTEPREPGDLPLRGSENWLFQLGKLITSGVPLTQTGKTFDNLNIISFNYDRSVQHYLPFAVAMAFGMDLNDAREMVANNLNITHPFGNIGRLPWETGDRPAVEWGDEEPANLAKLVSEIRTTSERMRNRQYVSDLQEALAGSERVVFLGFDFDPQTIDFLFGQPYAHNPEVIAAVQGMNEPTRQAALRVLRRQTGIADPGLVSVLDMRCFQFMRDYAVLLES